MQQISTPTAPRLEHRTDPGVVLGLGSARPRLSWTVPSAPTGYVQTAYEVEVDRGGHVERFRVNHARQILVPWPSSPLASREALAVRVRVAHGDDWSEWSRPTEAEAGLLTATDWHAAFISPAEIGTPDGSAPVLMGSVNVPGRISRARLYVTAHGTYEPRINGTRVGDTVLSPGWTSYEHRLRYHTYDVTHDLSVGTNELEITLGNGWYRGRLAFGHGRPYGDRLALLAQLEVTLEDGRTVLLATDPTWTARESEVLANDLYDGQRTDLRRRSRELHAVSRVEVVPGDLARLVAPDGPPVRVTDILPAQAVWTSPSGRTIADFGQNLVGWVRLTVRDLQPGAEVIVRHAEVLEDGELATLPLRGADATDTYVVAGAPFEVLEPSLTFHGFRYAEIQGPADLGPDDVEAIVIGSDLRRTGWFSSSNQLLDRFHENVVWSMRGNFLDVPMDCPQRDERLGWTGDIQVFAPAATYLYDAAGFLSSWLADVAAEQHADGSVPFIVPDVLKTEMPAAAAWGDAAALVPWLLYQRTGDLQILERQLPSMRAWVDKVTELAGRDLLWTGGFQFGDWLDPTAPEESPHRAKADPDVIATAHFARSAHVVARAALLLGDEQAAKRYADLARDVRSAFQAAYVTPAGRVHSDAQTVYALAIEWDLLEAEQRSMAGARLADLVRQSGYRIGTGFVGTPLVCDALTSTGHVEVAHRLLLQTGCPSWLYPVTMGATTVWERWDSMLPDGRIKGSAMTSFNHYAFGAVVDWMHRSVAGLAPAAPGFQQIVVRPQPPRAMTSAAARHLTPYGEASVAWERQDGMFELEVLVPVGSRASVHVPGSDHAEVVGHGRHRWRVPDPAAGDDHLLSSIRDVMDDADLWLQVVEAAMVSGIASGGEVETAEKLARYLDQPVTQLIRVLAPPESFVPAGNLEELIAEAVPSGRINTAAAPPRASRAEVSRPL